MKIGGYSVPGTGGGGVSMPSNPGQVFGSLDDFVNGAKKDPKGALEKILPFMGPGGLSYLGTAKALGIDGHGKSKVDTAGTQPPFMKELHLSTDPSQQLDMTGYDQIKGMLGQDNPWFKMQNQSLDQQYGQAMNQNVNATRNAMTGGMNQLAASGGFDAGSRERMARGVQTQGMMGAQGLSAGNAQNRLNLGIANQQMQADLAGKLGSMDLANKGYTAGLKQADYGSEADIWKTKMGAWGAAKTGDAIQNAGKK